MATAKQLAEQEKLFKANYAAAPVRFDLRQKLADIKSNAGRPLPAKEHLEDATEVLLAEAIAEIQEADRECSERLINNIQHAPMSDNVLHQGMLFRSIFDGAIIGGSEAEGLETIHQQVMNDTLKRFDTDQDFQDQFMAAQNLPAGQVAEAREALSDRLLAEKERISKKRQLQAELMAHVNARAARLARGQSLGKARLRASGKDTQVTAGLHPQFVPDGVYIFEKPQKGNFLKKFFLGNYNDLRHHIKEGGTVHKFHPANKKSLLMVVDSMRAQGMTSVDIKLGHVVDQMNRFGGGSPEYFRKPRDAGLEFKFRFETGIPYASMKKFLDDDYSVEQMELEFDSTLEALNTAEQAYLNAPTDSSAKRAYKKAKANFDEHMKAIDAYFGKASGDEVTDLALASDPITANVTGLELGVEETKRYEAAVKMRQLLALKVRPHAADRVVKDIQHDPDLSSEQKQTMLASIKVKNVGEHVEAMMQKAQAAVPPTPPAPAPM